MEPDSENDDERASWGLLGSCRGLLGVGGLQASKLHKLYIHTCTLSLQNSTDGIQVPSGRGGGGGGVRGDGEKVPSPILHGLLLCLGFGCSFGCTLSLQNSNDGIRVTTPVEGVGVGEGGPGEFGGPDGN